MMTELSPSGGLLKDDEEPPIPPQPTPTSTPTPAPLPTLDPNQTWLDTLELIASQPTPTPSIAVCPAPPNEVEMTLADYLKLLREASGEFDIFLLSPTSGSTVDIQSMISSAGQILAVGTSVDPDPFRIAGLVTVMILAPAYDVGYDKITGTGPYADMPIHYVIYPTLIFLFIAPP